MKLVVDSNKCSTSGECILACPVGAIRIADGIARIDMGSCDLDGICIPACPEEAISYLED